MTRPDHRAAALTFLFTDIEGSTSLWERHHAAMAGALERHDDLLRGAIESNGGEVFKTVGDAFYSAFADPAAAIRAAVEIQLGIQREDWSAFAETGAAANATASVGGPNSTPPAPEQQRFDSLRVRVALHTGRAEARGGDYFGPALNRAARLVSASHGGQILLSQATRDMLVDSLPDGLSLRDLGEHRLKDLRYTDRLFQVVGTSLPDVVQSPATAGKLRAGDRIIVAGEGEAPETTARVVVDRTVEETFAALLNVIRRDESTVVLTGDQVRAAARHRPKDLTEYRLGRIAEWSQPRYRLDDRFVQLTLLVDQGEEASAARWRAVEQRYTDLSELLRNQHEPAVVVLGPPGAGKSTLLRHLELQHSITALRRETEKPELPETVAFFAQLNDYRADRPGQFPPAPGDWLGMLWHRRFPDLPALEELIAEGRMLLLLDALNEMPAGGDRHFGTWVGWWRDWVVDLARTKPGNRVVFSCRALDYSAPLSTAALRVPQVMVEPLSDDQIREFLRAYSPIRGEAIWSALEATPQLDALRAPFFIALLVEQVEATGELPTDRAGLFTGFVRQAIKREMEQGNLLFSPNGLVAARDARKVVQWSWRNAYELPSRGELVPKLSALAHAMQVAHGSSAGTHLRVPYNWALDQLDTPHDEDIVKAGTALAVLEEDPASDEVMYRHQLFQEYFAARILAAAPEPERARASWRSSEVSPSLRDVLDALAPADELPALPQTGWEETTLLATAVTDDPQGHILGLISENLVLAGRAAVQATVMPKLDEDLLGSLRRALADRSRDVSADLRERVRAGFALGTLGDPRFETISSPHGEYLRPQMIELAGGEYPIGDDDPISELGSEWRDHMPRHRVSLAPFAIGKFPVTNAEWARFIATGGYDDERWWETPDARDWLQGSGTSKGIHARVRWQVATFRRQPELLEGLYESGQWPKHGYERYLKRIAMSEEELEAHLFEMYPGGKLREPAFWRYERLSNPAQPVVGVSWYEARAYCAWLSNASGIGGQPGRYRLPTEAEHEAAQRGKLGRRWAMGDEFDPLAANTVSVRIKRTSPVGVFVEGDTPEGVSDLCGNVTEWTSSRWGRDPGKAEFGYPYDPTDGREDESAGPDVLCVLRGASWARTADLARAVNRINRAPSSRYDTDGFRLARSV